MEEENWEERAQMMLGCLVDILHPIVSNGHIWTIALAMREQMEADDDESQRES